jgi:Ca2+-binding RTX toxin-like protein
MPTINGTAGGETLNGTSGQDNIFGLGGDDGLFGLADADLLDGGEGRDTMAGGTGNDRYVVDDPLDAIVEGAGEGDDWLHSSVSYALGAGVSIEVMTTLNAAGIAALNLAGNEFGQSIYGNAGANWLSGGGGSDYLVGLGGNDVYIVDDLTDTIFEAAGEGDDRIISSDNYILGAGVSVETLGTANAASTAVLHLTGNELGQSIYGSAGENWLSGGGGGDYLVGLDGNDILWGGAGSDNLSGGAGNDVFSFNPNDGAAIDFITDFVSGSDKINLGHFTQGIDFIGSAEFTGWPGQGRLANGLFELDVDGDGIVELAFMINGGLTTGDFVFRDDIGYGTGGWDGSGSGWWDY